MRVIVKSKTFGDLEFHVSSEHAVSVEFTRMMRVSIAYDSFVGMPRADIYSLGHDGSVRQVIEASCEVVYPNPLNGVPESDMKTDIEEMARILDYIGLDYKNCTMDSNFCDYAQAFVERLVNKYQTHRAE